jgi:hypothetical protein
MLELQQTVQEQNIFVSKLELAFCTGEAIVAQWYSKGK